MKRRGTARFYAWDQPRPWLCNYDYYLRLGTNDMSSSVRRASFDVHSANWFRGVRSTLFFVLSPFIPSSLHFAAPEPDTILEGMDYPGRK